MKTLVLGASTKEDRYSNRAIRMLLSYGNEVVALGNKPGEVAGVLIQKGLIPFEGVHTVTVYLNAQNQEVYRAYILSLKPARVIFNPGAENVPFASELRAAGVEVEFACTLVMLRSGEYNA